jgi:hypothetical protein
MAQRMHPERNQLALSRHDLLFERGNLPEHPSAVVPSVDEKRRHVQELNHCCVAPSQPHLGHFQTFTGYHT